MHGLIRDKITLVAHHDQMSEMDKTDKVLLCRKLISFLDSFKIHFPRTKQ